MKKMLTTDEITIEIAEIYYYQSDFRFEDYDYFYRTMQYTDKGEVMYDYYLMNIFIDGTAKFRINGIDYTAEKDNVRFLKPHMLFSKNTDYKYSCYSTTFNVYKKDTGELINGSKKYSCFLDFIPDISKPENLPTLLNALAHYSQCNGDSEHIKLKRKIYYDRIIYELYSLYKKFRDETTMVHPAVTKAFSYINHNLDVIHLSIGDIAKAVGLSDKYFQKIFKKCTGETPNAYLTRIRLEIAVKKLLVTDMSVADIAFESGFSSSSYFNKVFKKAYNQSPTDYKIWNLKGI